MNAAANIEDGMTPLHWLCQRNIALGDHVDIARALIKAGANLDAWTSEVGSTPLSICALHGHLELAQALIQAGADVKNRNFFDDTPLHRSAENGHLEMSKFLIEKGASVYAYNVDEETPIDLDPRLAEFQRNGVRPRQAKGDGEGQDRNVRQRVGGEASSGVKDNVDVDCSIDAVLADAIHVLFRKMNHPRLKNDLHRRLSDMRA